MFIYFKSILFIIPKMVINLFLEKQIGLKKQNYMEVDAYA